MFFDDPIREIQFLKYSELKEFAKANPSIPIIDGFLNRKEFMLINAASKVGKSLLAMNLGISASAGSTFCGMPTTQSKVMYLQTEIAHNFLLERLNRMINQQIEFEECMFLTSFERIRLDDKDDFKSLELAIENEKPDLLILDPFYELHSKNEQNANEMTPILTNLRMLARKHDLGLILIHHQGKNSENNGNSKTVHQSRGSSAFGDVPDCLVSLNKTNDLVKLTGIFRNRPNINLTYSIDPESLTVSNFKNLEAPQMIKKEKKIDLIFKLLSESSEPISKDFIKKQIDCDASTINKHLKSLIEQDKIRTSNDLFFRT